MALLTQPGDDDIKRVRVEAGDRLIVDFDPSATEVELAEGHLVLRFPSGAIIVLEGFAEAATEPGAVAVQLPDGRMIDGAYIAEIAEGLQNLVPLETAAGDEVFEPPASGGSSTYSDSLGDIVDEIESLVQAGLFAPTAIDVRAAAPIGSFEVAATSQFFSGGLAGTGADAGDATAGGGSATDITSFIAQIVDSSDPTTALELQLEDPTAFGPAEFDPDSDGPLFNSSTSAAIEENATGTVFSPIPGMLTGGFLTTLDPEAGDRLLLQYIGPDSGSIREKNGKLEFTESDDVWSMTLDVSTLSFAFEMLKPYHHDIADIDAFVTQRFKFTLFRGNGEESLFAFAIRFNDDTPIANDDAFSLAGTSVAGNVIDGNNDVGKDDLGADGARVAGVAFGALGLAVPTDDSTTTIEGEFGTLRIDATGSFTYQLDTASTTPPQSNDNEKFRYTLIDGDGDTDTAELTIDLDSMVMLVVASQEDSAVIPFEALVDLGDDDLVELSSVGAAMGPGPSSATSEGANPGIPMMSVDAGEVSTVTIAELIDRIEVQVM